MTQSTNTKLSSENNLATQRNHLMPAANTAITNLKFKELLEVILTFRRASAQAVDIKGIIAKREAELIKHKYNPSRTPEALYLYWISSGRYIYDAMASLIQEEKLQDSRQKLISKN